MNKDKKKPKLEDIAVLVKLEGSNKAYRIMLKGMTKDFIVQAIFNIEGTMKILEDPIESIEFKDPQ